MVPEHGEDHVMDTRNISGFQLLWLSSDRNVSCPHSQPLHSHVQRILYLPAWARTLNPIWEAQLSEAPAARPARIVALTASSASIFPIQPKHLEILLEDAKVLEHGGSLRIRCKIPTGRKTNHLELPRSPGRWNPPQALPLGRLPVSHVIPSALEGVPGAGRADREQHRKRDLRAPGKL